jgi:hypothetical protein
MDCSAETAEQFSGARFVLGSTYFLFCIRKVGALCAEEREASRGESVESCAWFRKMLKKLL